LRLNRDLRPLILGLELVQERRGDRQAGIFRGELQLLGGRLEFGCAHVGRAALDAVGRPHEARRVLLLKTQVQLSDSLRSVLEEDRGDFADKIAAAVRTKGAEGFECLRIENMVFGHRLKGQNQGR
jgi:hypothetical protein